MATSDNKLSESATRGFGNQVAGSRPGVDDLQRLHEELQVHHIELKLQNEELLRVQLELEESRDRYRALYDEAPIGYLTLSPDSTVLAANSTAARLLGLERAALVGSPLSRMMDRPSADLLHLHLQRVVVDGRRHACELQLIRADGQRIWVQLESGPGEAHGGSQRTSRTTFSDVSERRRLEAQVQRAEQLEAIGRLASGVAHEFNNLLMGILGSASAALLDLGSSGRAVELLRDIKGEAIRGATLTRQLLVLGRPHEDGGSVVDTNTVVAQNEQLLRRTLGAEINIEFHLEAKDGRVWANLGQLEQVLTNLVINARDALAPDGHIVVHTQDASVDTTRAKRLNVEPGQYVILTVSDDGYGMSEETKARLFEPFFSTKAVGEGSGLGLSTVYGIARRAGGAVEVESQRGVGTTVRVLLPRTTRPQASPGSSSDVELANLGGDEIVLVVEDEPLVRQTVARYLARWGYRVLEAANGIEALAIIKARTDIDLLLTDMVLPELDGSALSREAAELRPELRVLFMSAYPKVKLVRERRLDADARALQKPFTEDELLVTVREVLGHPGHSPATQPASAASETAASAASETSASAASEKTSASGGAGAKLLLVEDDPRTREVTGILLEDEGFEVHLASEGAEAIESARKLGPALDVVVSDLGLPNTSIDSLLRTLVELSQPRAIVILSGRSSNDPEVKGLPKMDNLVFLEKPILVEKLVSSIRGLLDRASGDQPGGASPVSSPRARPAH